MTNDEFIRQIFDELLTNLHSKIRQNSVGHYWRAPSAGPVVLKKEKGKFVKISQSSSKFVTVRQNFVKIRQDVVKIRQKIRHEIGFYSDE